MLLAVLSHTSLVVLHQVSCHHTPSRLSLSSSRDVPHRQLAPSSPFVLHQQDSTDGPHSPFGALPSMRPPLLTTLRVILQARAFSLLPLPPTPRQGVLYEDSFLQLGLQSCFSRAKGEVTLFLGNKHPAAALQPLGLVLSPPASGALQLTMGQVCMSVCCPVDLFFTRGAFHAWRGCCSGLLGRAAAAGPDAQAPSIWRTAAGPVGQVSGGLGSRAPGCTGVVAGGGVCCCGWLASFTWGKGRCCPA